MKVILTEDVVGLGDIGANVVVRPGYARNFLIPRGLAIETQARSAKSIAHKMLQIEARKRRLKKAAEDFAGNLRSLVLTFSLRVSSGGKVFGSISTRDIAAKLVEAGHDIDRRRVLLTEPLRKPGTHFVKVRLHPEVTVQVKVVIEQLAASKETE
jgi:large subunit ribosomal protein L9